MAARDNKSRCRIEKEAAVAALFLENYRRKLFGRLNINKKIRNPQKYSTQIAPGFPCYREIVSMRVAKYYYHCLRRKTHIRSFYRSGLRTYRDYG